MRGLEIGDDCFVDQDAVFGIADLTESRTVRFKRVWLINCEETLEEAERSGAAETDNADPSIAWRRGDGRNRRKVIGRPIHTPRSSWQNLHPPHLTIALTLGADAALFHQSEMDDASVLRIHRVEGKGDFRHAHAIGGFLRHQF